MSLDLDDERLLAKFYLSEYLYQFTIFYTQNFDILYNFASSMNVATDDLKIFASQVLQNVELSYEDVKMLQAKSGDVISIYEGNRIRIVMLLRPQAANEVVQSYIKPILKDFAEKYESKYRKELKAYAEYTGSFADIQEIMKDAFVLDLNLPHIARYKGFEPEDQLEKYIFQAADKFCKNVGYFYLRNLLFITKQFVVDEARNIVLTDPRRAKKEGIDPDHIDFPPDEMFFVAMFKLRRLGMLEAIQLDELNSYSKIKY
jgi:hypothetical protein